MNIQDYATKVVGAALRHDFGIPLGVIGRNVNEVLDIVEDFETSNHVSKWQQRVSQISEEITKIEAELYVEFKGFGGNIGNLGDFEREREYSKIRKSLSPKMIRLSEQCKILYKLSDDIRDTDVTVLSGQALSASRRIVNMFGGLSHFIRVGEISDEIFVPTDIRELASRNVATVRISKLNSALSVTPTLNGDATVECISSHLDQLIQNYISNAVKFSSLSEKPSVSINLGETSFGELSRKYRQKVGKFAGRGTWAEIVVADNGPGVDMEIRGSLFKLYSQRKPDRLEFDSTGVGLAVCQLVSHIHGGFVFFEREDDLTKFVALLPCKREHRIELVLNPSV
ncbi:MULTISPECIES: ATP-binding protein [Paracoccaceae]|uniref:ATP-binding protein n=1 Tax=Paracoccaceae TaxID=31989 RepID=UPI003299CF5F